MKIYTKTGDLGETSLFGGKRLSKNHIRVDAYGTVDELNAWLGLIRDQEIAPHLQGLLVNIQQNLFVLGAILGTDPKKKSLQKVKDLQLSEKEVDVLEQEIDRMETELPPMTHFILPGGHTSVSYCHIARTICRRAERKMVQLHAEEPLEELLLAYVNRLSDFLFVLARKLSKDLSVTEVKWIPDGKA